MKTKNFILAFIAVFLTFPAKADYRIDTDKHYLFVNDSSTYRDVTRLRYIYSGYRIRESNNYNPETKSGWMGAFHFDAGRNVDVEPNLLVDSRMLNAIIPDAIKNVLVLSDGVSTQYGTNALRYSFWSLKFQLGRNLNFIWTDYQHPPAYDMLTDRYMNLDNTSEENWRVIPDQSQSLILAKRSMCFCDRGHKVRTCCGITPENSELFLNQVARVLDTRNPNSFVFLQGDNGFGIHDAWETLMRPAVNKLNAGGNVHAYIVFFCATGSDIKKCTSTKSITQGKGFGYGTEGDYKGIILTAANTDGKWYFDSPKATPSAAE